MNSTLISQTLKAERKILLEDMNILKMAIDLYSAGVTSAQVEKEAKFSKLNARYMKLSGYTGLTIGSVYHAVIHVLKDIEEN